MMGVLRGGHEIVELTEQDDEIIANPGKQHVRGTLKNYSLGDDINKLFEAIEIRSSHRVVGRPERHLKGDFSKSAMKRPMRFDPSPVSGIGVAEPVSLKQALRGLCISQASEMAAVKKRMSRLSAAPGISNVVATKKLYKENLVEILLIPEKSSSEFSFKGPELEAAKSTDTKTEVGVAPLQCSMGFEFLEAGIDQNKKLELVPSSTSTAVLEKLSVLDEVFPEMDENQITADEQHKQEVDKLQSAPLNFNLERNTTKTPKTGFISSKPSLRTQNIMKKKIVQKASAMRSRGQHKKMAKCDDHDYHPTGVICQTPDCIKECEELEKLSPVSSRNTELAAYSVSNDHDMTGSRGKSVMAKCDERSRSKERGEFSQSSKSSMGEYSSTTTSHSEESYLSGSNRSGYRPHMSRDLRWEAISCVRNRQGSLGMRHFKLLRKVGGGDIGTVYLSELIGTNCLFAVKVMNNDLLASKKKILRAQTEKEILEILDHPFLPTLYAHFATNKFTCLVMEYCPGGDLHVLRQRQPTNSFSEHAARFYVAEVLLALEYLHMLGVVYRDLKPENVLVREDGHIMLTDFDLSFRCAANPTFVKSSFPAPEPPDKISSPCFEPSCIDPFCLQPSWNLPCFSPRFLSTASKTRKPKSELAPQIIPLPQLVVEPINARSNSFVGTHEYLAPEIIKGEGHGSAVDWWTFGILLYELLYGRTPFKGLSNEDTVSNVSSQCLKFPECPMLSSHARDLIRRLLTKEPENRLGSVKGAVEIMQHPFFDGLNFALIRCETPPEVPKFFDLANVFPDVICPEKTNKGVVELESGKNGIEFEMF